MNNTLELGLAENVGSGLMPEVINGKVDARSVHEALEVSSGFSNWWKRRTEDFGFVEGEDFFSSNLTGKHGNRMDYDLTLDMAKELAMVERNEMGRKMRRYFIECEKRLGGGGSHPPGQAQPGLNKLETALVDLAREHDGRIAKLESQMIPGAGWMSIAEYIARRWELAPHNGQLSFLTKRCLQESAARKFPIGEERTPRYKRRRTFAPEVLETCIPLTIVRWNNEGRLATMKGGQPA